MALGNWFVIASLALNLGAFCAYVWQRQWPQALYWLGALIINSAVLWQAR